MAPAGLLKKLKSYYAPEEVHEVPPLSVTTAASLLILYTLLYVLPFYLSPTTRPSVTLTRDAPSVILARMRSVTYTCVLCALSTFLILTYVSPHGSWRASLHLLGLSPPGLLESAKTLLLTSILFLGPLFEAGLAEGAWRSWIRLRGLTTLWTDLPTRRNLLAGPLTEEILFRACSLPLFLLTPVSASPTTLFLLPPLIFGLAHIHHIYEFRLLHPSVPLYHAVLRSLVQLTYTTLFGSFATFVYLRTASLLAVVLCHAFCNWMGLPRVWGRVEGGGAESVMGPDVGQAKRDEDEDEPQTGPLLGPLGENRELGIAWTVVYYVLLVVGAVAFYKYFWVLTESGNALMEF